MNLINRVAKLSLIFNSLALKYDNSYESFLLNNNNPSVEDLFIKSLFRQLMNNQNSLKYIFLLITILKLAKKYKKDALTLIRNIFDFKEDFKLSNLFEQLNSNLNSYNSLFTQEEVKVLSIALLQNIL